MLNNIKYTDQQIAIVKSSFERLYSGIMLYDYTESDHEDEENLFAKNNKGSLLLAAQMYFIQRTRVDAITNLIEKARKDSKVRPFKKHDTFMQIDIRTTKIKVSTTSLSWRKGNKKIKKTFEDLESFIKWMRSFLKKAKKKGYVPLGHAG